jgi:hypothetical protein
MIARNAHPNAISQSVAGPVLRKKEPECGALSPYRLVGAAGAGVEEPPAPVVVEGGTRAGLLTVEPVLLEAVLSVRCGSMNKTASATMKNAAAPITQLGNDISSAARLLQFMGSGRLGGSRLSGSLPGS